MPITNYDKKIFRLLSILNQLDKRGKVFVISLAEEFSVSVRSVQRDLKLLSEAGFPIDRDPETGAYIFVEGFQLGKSRLTEKEWALLLSFEDMAKKIGPPFGGLMSSIVKKNLHPDALCDWFYFKVEEPAAVPDIEGLLSTLIEAIRSQETITFTYSVYSEYQARVKPFRIIQFGGFWYLLGEDTADHVTKKYALDQIKKPKGTGKYFTAVPDDLNKILDESFNVWFGPKRGKKIVVEVSEVAADYFKRKKWFPNQEIIEEKKNGNLVISYLVSDFREILPFLKSWVPKVWVIRPNNLKYDLQKQFKQAYNQLI
jgi:predicted DNA-binding transcriptional regulator YafY